VLLKSLFLPIKILKANICIELFDICAELRNAQLSSENSPVPDKQIDNNL
jgi:hypothetical protein